jgi:hypothetical protein
MSKARSTGALLGAMLMATSLAAASASRGVYAMLRPKKAKQKEKPWLPKKLPSGVSPYEFGTSYKPNQRKRRKQARRLGLHPANSQRRSA